MRAFEQLGRWPTPAGPDSAPAAVVVGRGGRDRRRRPRRAPLPAGVGHEAAGEPGDPRGGRGGDAGSRRPGRARPARPSATSWPTRRAWRPTGTPSWPLRPGAASTRTPASRCWAATCTRPAASTRPPTSTKRSSSRSASPPRRCPPAPPPPTGRTPAPPTSARVALELLEPTLVDPTTLATATAPVFPELAGVLPGFGPQDPNPWGLGFEIRGHKIAALDLPGQLSPDVRPLRTSRDLLLGRSGRRHRLRRAHRRRLRRPGRSRPGPPSTTPSSPSSGDGDPGSAPAAPPALHDQAHDPARRWRPG